eukprot:14232183-Heterocapsa_arctica.AAC.1
MGRHRGDDRASCTGRRRAISRLLRASRRGSMEMVAADPEREAPARIAGVSQAARRAARTG